MRYGEMKRSVPLHRRCLLARRFFQLERATKFYLADFYGVGFLFAAGFYPERPMFVIATLRM